MDDFYAGPVFGLSCMNCGYPPGDLQGLQATPRSDSPTILISSGLNLENHIPLPRNTHPYTEDSCDTHPATVSNVPCGYRFSFSFWHSVQICNRHSSI